jgi:hypothetical protein
MRRARSHRRLVAHACAWLAATTLAAGCSVELPEGVFACSADQDCPSGWSCRAEGRCYSAATGAPDAARPDAAATDAGPLDGAAGPQDATTPDAGQDFEWRASAWGACTGGTATEAYEPWGACTGGSGRWSYGAWGSCSASAVCSGGGTEVRPARCEAGPDSGQQSRLGACAWSAGSGTQSRELRCVDRLGQDAPSDRCADVPPPTAQACTPAGAPEACGALVTMRACTPTDDAACGPAEPRERACASPEGTRACTIAHGAGVESCAGGGSTWSACMVTACDPGYTVVGNACVQAQYGWSLGPWGQCSGGAATPVYGPWGTCSGGSGTWSYSTWSTCAGGAAQAAYGAWGACMGGSGTWGYGAWGRCSAAVCTGAGTQQRSATCNGAPDSGAQSRSGACEWATGSGAQSRSASCSFAAGTGGQSRTGSCVWDAGSGVSTRTLTCVDAQDRTVAEALCGPRPPASQGCTPTGAATTCGALVTSQGCTPSDPAVCGAQGATTQACTPTGAPAACGALETSRSCTPTSPAACGASEPTTQSCSSPAGSRACTIANGTGAESCDAGETTWGACTVQSCDTDYFVVSNTCLDRCASGVGPFFDVGGCGCGPGQQLCGFEELYTPANGRCEVQRVACLCAGRFEKCSI